MAATGLPPDRALTGPARCVGPISRGLGKARDCVEVKVLCTCLLTASSSPSSLSSGELKERRVFVMRADSRMFCDVPLSSHATS